MSDSHHSLSARGESPRVKRKASSSRSPFIVDTSADMLKKHGVLSRNARHLYLTMRGLADGKTGELRIEGRWLKATAFDRAAEMCKNTRLPAMRELIDSGFVTLKRPRVWWTIRGRMRAVAGAAEYTVHREPIPLKSLQKSKDSSKVHLQKSIFSTTQEMDPQVLSNTPLGAGGSVFPDSENDSGSESAKSSSAPADDDSRASQLNLKGNGNGKPNHNPPVEEKQTRVEKILDRAADTLKKRGEDPVFVAEALAFIDQRSHEVGTVPGSERYYLVAYETLLDAPDDLAEVTDSVIRKKSLRAKFMPHPIIPNEKDTAKIAIVHQVVEEAARIGRPASEIMAERLVKRVKLAKSNGKAWLRQLSAKEL